MSKKQAKILKNQIKQILHLYEMEDFSARLNSLLQETKINQSECDDLQKLTKIRLKLILDLNLLPSYEFICHSLEKQSNEILAKADPGEILTEDFQIIEQQAINLNLARVKYIQDNF